MSNWDNYDEEEEEADDFIFKPKGGSIDHSSRKDFHDTNFNVAAANKYEGGTKKSMKDVIMDEDPWKKGRPSEANMKRLKDIYMNYKFGRFVRQEEGTAWYPHGWESTA